VVVGRIGFCCRGVAQGKPVLLLLPPLLLLRVRGLAKKSRC
jgi:hypothetical protein